MVATSLGETRSAPADPVVEAPETQTSGPLSSFKGCILAVWQPGKIFCRPLLISRLFLILVGRILHARWTLGLFPASGSGDPFRVVSSRTLAHGNPERPFNDLQID